MAWFQRKIRDAVLVNLTGHGIAAARLSGTDDALEVSTFTEISAEDEGGLQRWVETEFPNRSARYLACYAGFSPADRVLERESINGKRVMDRAYVFGLLNQRHPTASPADWQISFLDTNTGIPLAPDPSTRPGLFFGMPLAEISSTQRRLTDAGLRAQRLELGILPVLGGMLRWRQTSGYTHRMAVCEIGPAQTRLYLLAKDGVHTPSAIPYGLTSIAEGAMKELGSADIATARLALQNPSPEFAAQAKRHVRMITRHLRPAIDAFEMQTGARIGGLYCHHLPSGYGWLERAVAPALDLEDLSIPQASWEATLGVKVASDAALPENWFQTLCLVGKLEAATAGEPNG